MSEENNEILQAELIRCRAVAGVPLAPSKPWVTGEAVSFVYAPAGLHTISAGFRQSESITISVEVDADTAKTLQASFESVAASERQEPYADEDHEAKKATLRFPPGQVKFEWGNVNGELGVVVQGCQPTSYGAEAVNGKVYRSWSPEFGTDADYAKATCKRGHWTFPEGVRGSASNPARLTGVGFVTGALTNKPAFRAMPPVKAKQAEVTNEWEVFETVTFKVPAIAGETPEQLKARSERLAGEFATVAASGGYVLQDGVKASGTSEGVKKSWETRHGGASEITKPGQRIATVAYRIVHGAAKQYPYTGAKVYESYVGKSGQLKARPVYEHGPDRRSERLSEEDAIEHAKSKNIPFHHGIRQGFVFNERYGEEQDEAVEKNRETVYNDDDKLQSTSTTSDPATIYASIEAQRVAIADLTSGIRPYRELELEDIYARLGKAATSA